jgi:hypothetical protein
MTNKRRWRWSTAIIVTFALAVLLGLGWAVFEKISRTSSASQASPSATISSEPTGSPEPSSESFSDEEGPGDESGHVDHDTPFESCVDTLSSEELDALKERALSYELVWISGDTPEKQAGIERFGTEQYIEANRVFVDPTLEIEWPSYELDSELTRFSCEERFDGSVTVAVLPRVRAFQVEDDVVVYTSEWYDSPLHVSEWVLDFGEWRVRAER